MIIADAHVAQAQHRYTAFPGRHTRIRLVLKRDHNSENGGQVAQDHDDDFELAIDPVIVDDPDDIDAGFVITTSVERFRLMCEKVVISSAL